MKLISWNVNGLRACVKKGFLDFFKEIDANIFCIQESKMQDNQNDIDFKALGYHTFWNNAEKKGYSSSVVFSKEKPLSVQLGMNKKEHDNEGRVIVCEYEKFYLVNVYTPNSKEKLARLDYRQEWEDDFLIFIKNLESGRGQFSQDYKNIKKSNDGKPVIICGDLNVAHREIDLKNPKANRKNAGFSDEERGKFSTLLESGFIDSYRYFYPDVEGAYTWWSYFSNSREKNIGWRIDYFLLSNILEKNLKEAYIFNDIYGSDHCPVGIKIEL